MKLKLTETAENIVKKAAFDLGSDANFNQTQEECAELIVAINHFRRNRIDWEDLAEEIADVYLMIHVLYEWMNMTGLGELINEKLIDKAYKLQKQTAG